MSHEVFTDGWSRACCERLNAREGYRRVAAGWESSVVLILRADPGMGLPEERAVFLELGEGRCREARVATPDDPATAGFVLAAGAGVWKRILSGRLDPVSAILFGKLRLEKGSLAALAPYHAAARELLAAAAEVEAHFPAPVA